MKHSAEYEAFTNLVDQVLSVPKAEILRREAEYKRQSDRNPHKRGPKKVKKPSSASRDGE